MNFSDPSYRFMIIAARLIMGRGGADGVVQTPNETFRALCVNLFKSVQPPGNDTFKHTHSALSNVLGHTACRETVTTTITDICDRDRVSVDQAFNTYATELVSHSMPAVHTFYHLSGFIAMLLETYNVKIPTESNEGAAGHGAGAWVTEWADETVAGPRAGSVVAEARHDLVEVTDSQGNGLGLFVRRMPSDGFPYAVSPQMHERPIIQLCVAFGETAADLIATARAERGGTISPAEQQRIRTQLLLQVREAAFSLYDSLGLVEAVRNIHTNSTVRAAAAIIRALYLSVALKPAHNIEDHPVPAPVPATAPAPAHAPAPVPAPAPATAPAPVPATAPAPAPASPTTPISPVASRALPTPSSPVEVSDSSAPAPPTVARPRTRISSTPAPFTPSQGRRETIAESVVKGAKRGLAAMGGKEPHEPALKRATPAPLDESESDELRSPIAIAAAGEGAGVGAGAGEGAGFESDDYESDDDEPFNRWIAALDTITSRRVHPRELYPSLIEQMHNATSDLKRRMLSELRRRDLPYKMNTTKYKDFIQ